MKRRVVVTGIGAISPIGNDANTMWENAKKGINGIDFIKRFDAKKIDFESFDFGKYSSIFVKDNFDLKFVFDQYLKIYEEN